MTSTLGLPARLMHAVVAVAMLIWQCGLPAVLPAADATAGIHKACPCCVQSACGCDGVPVNSQPAPVTPATNDAAKISFLARIHEDAQAGQTLVAPRGDGLRSSRTTDAMTSGRSVPLYCRYCARLT